jgi:hypothetical protein
LTPETAKKICLSTHSQKAKDVQQYFIDLELALYKYKNYIIDGMNRKIKQLETNQKPNVNPEKKIIYVFRALNSDTTLYKIGKTINSKSRLLSHNSPLANNLEVIFQYETDNADQVESCIKAQLKNGKYRKYKEIYQVDLDLIKESIQSCDSMISKINKKIHEKEKLYMLVTPINNNNDETMKSTKSVKKNPHKNNQKKTILNNRDNHKTKNSK